jgi:hypothetical protein
MKLRSVMTVLALTGALPCLAADPVDVVLSGFAYGWQTATIKNTDLGNEKTVTASAGAYAGTLNGKTSFVTFCTDIYQTLGFGPKYEYDRLTVAETKGLWGNDSSKGTTYNSNSYDLVSKLFTTAYGQVNNSVTSAAFQFALWELLYEKGSSYNLGTGKLTITGSWGQSAAAQDLANTWLMSVAGSNAGYDVQSLFNGQYNPSGTGAQDLVIATPVPEPAAYALALVSLGIVAGYARRKRDKA